MSADATRDEPPREPPIGAAPDAAPGGARLRTLLGVGLLLVALWLVARFLREVGLRDVFERLRSTHYLGIVGAAGFVLLHLFLWGHRWKVAVRRIDGKPRRRVIYAALAASASINLVAPFLRVLGGWARARYLTRAGERSFAAFVGVVLFDQLFHFAVMSGVTLAALLAGALLAHNYVLAAGMAAGAAALGGLLVAWVGPERDLGDPRRLARRFGRGRMLALAPVRALARHGGETIAVLQRLLADRPLRWRMVAYGGAIFLATAAAQACVFYAMDEPVRPLVVLVSVAIGTAAGTLAGTPGGLGATEAAMIALYVALGIDRVTAAAAALLYRSVYYLVVLATGLPSLVVLEWALVRSPAAAGELSASEDPLA